MFMGGNHALSLENNGWVIMGNMALYKGEGGKLSTLPNLGITVEDQAALVIKDHTYCLLVASLIVKSQTTIALRSVGKLRT